MTNALFADLRWLSAIGHWLLRQKRRAIFGLCAASMSLMCYAGHAEEAGAATNQLTSVADAAPAIETSVQTNVAAIADSSSTVQTNTPVVGETAAPTVQTNAAIVTDTAATTQTNLPVAGVASSVDTNAPAAAAAAATVQTNEPAAVTPVTTETNTPVANTAQTNAPATAQAQTNTVQTLPVQKYRIVGNTLLSADVVSACFADRFGTNVSVETIFKGVSELILAYRARGYQTVSATLPPQTITNGVVIIQVFEGKLADISVTGNRYFSSANVMRALPSLKTNIYLNNILFQAELDRANGNRDRQIYPRIDPGPEPNTSSLVLEVKDRFPFHAKIELNNQSTPGTPPIRLNTSFVYNNLWQREHSAGFQYSMSPGEFKSGDQWRFYDLPLIANYSGYYRLPLAGAESVSEAMEARPGEFGYNEGSRKFVLPPSSGAAELNFYASRSTIDTGVETGNPTQMFVSPDGSLTIDRRDDHQDLTITEDVGFRLSLPGVQDTEFRSSFSMGLDYKTYQLTSFATNVFIFTQFLVDENNNPLPPKVSETASTVPSSHQSLNYIPFTFRWDASWTDKHGTTTVGIGYTINTWYSGSKSNLQQLAFSSDANGIWQTLSPSLTRDQNLGRDWRLYLHGDGQLASEPLISNEQYGLGGIAGVRGYREGEVFGDAGWRAQVELRTPTYMPGLVDDKIPMHLRGSLFMDYGESYLLDPGPREGRTPMWGTGVGLSVTIGSTWEGRIMLAWPLLDVPSVKAGQTRAYFGVSAQF
jgi:hemolysin activation/secretion protein